VAAAAGGTAPSLPVKLQEALDLTLKRWGEAEPRHTHHTKRWEHFYGLYRSFKDTKRQYMAAKTRRDVDEVLREARAGFGADLFIPYVFSTIETIVPRMLSNNPTLRVDPADPLSEDNVDAMKLIVTQQQDRTKFAIGAQDVVKLGCIYGLGPAKTCWHRDTINAPVLEPAEYPSPEKKWVVGPSQERVIYEGPRMEPVDPFDFVWDPYGWDMRTIGYLFHRTWRDEEYVRRMVEQGTWKLPRGWKIEDLLGGGSRSKRDDVWGGRLEMQGMPRAEEREREIHEVWEYHDGNQVITVIDRHCVVQMGQNPYWRVRMPFQIYRPTRLPHEMVGIGEPEAMEDLQEEMNQLRRGRRDNAALVMQRPFAYMDGMLTPSQIQFGPAAMWPVDGNPSEVIFPIPLQDLPFSSYREEDNLKADIERVTGIDDSSSGVGGAEQTATGVQLVQAAANIRIQNKAKLFETETAKECCEQWVALNQQHIIEDVDVPGPPKPDEGDREFSWYRLGPAELAGTFAIEPEAGSMSPQNDVAKKQNAQIFMQTFAPMQGITDPRKIAQHGLTEFGVRNPENYLVPEMPKLDPRILDLIGQTLMQEGRVAPDEFQALVQEAEQALQPPDQAGPGGMPGNAGAPAGPQGGPQQGPPPQQGGAEPPAG
jgi:hypothetical protein